MAAPIPPMSNIQMSITFLIRPNFDQICIKIQVCKVRYFEAQYALRLCFPLTINVCHAESSSNVKMLLLLFVRV